MKTSRIIFVIAVHGFIHLNSSLPEAGRDVKMLVNQDSGSVEDKSKITLFKSGA